jgi:hypothetical protein
MTKQFICMVVLLWAVCGRSASAQTEQVASVGSHGFRVPSAFSGEEPSFTDSEGDLTGPSEYVFHFLPEGKAFMDWASRRSGKSGRTFGVYSILQQRNGVKVVAQFIPGLDSLASEIPATDWFDTFTFRFAHRKARAIYSDDPNAPMFPISRVPLKK